MSNNFVRLKGNIGNKPDIATSQDGKQRATFSVAVSESYFDKDNNAWVQTEPQWFNVVAFGSLEIMEAKNLQKGSLVSVEGRLKLNEFETKDENGTKTKHKVFDVVATSLVEIVRRKKEQAA